MKFKVKTSSVFECSLERAFKTPMLCDVTKVHSGFGPMPKVVKTTDDQDWGKLGSSKKVYMAKSISQKGGYSLNDNILERVENKYWKIQVDHFQSRMFGFYKFVGIWKTTEMEESKIRVDYTYYLHANTPVLYPINWIFAKTLWKIYMRKVLANVKNMAYAKEPYQYK